MHEEYLTDKGRIKFGIVKAWDPLVVEWKREIISNAKHSPTEDVDITKDDLDIQEAEKKINAISKRTNHFTTFILVVMTLISTGVLLTLCSLCVSK